MRRTMFRPVFLGPIAAAVFALGVAAGAAGMAAIAPDGGAYDTAQEAALVRHINILQCEIEPVDGCAWAE